MHYRMMNKKMYEQNTPQARFFLWNKIRRRQVLSNKMLCRPDFLTKSWWMVCPIDVRCNLFFTNHSSEYSFFNQWINGLINSWINDSNQLIKPIVCLFPPLAIHNQLLVRWWRLLLLLLVKKNVVVLFGTLKVQSFMLTKVWECDLLIVVTSSTFLKRKDMLKEKAVSPDHVCLRNYHTANPPENLFCLV